MSARSLADMLERLENPAVAFRENDYTRDMYEFSDEYTTWIEEQRAVMESCTIVDQSYHMSPLYVEGSDALEVFADIGTNNFQNFRDGEPPIAKNVVFCNPDGYMIRDVVLFYVGNDRFVSAGTDIPNNWALYNIEMGDYDVSAEIPYRPGTGADPREFRFQVQGPHAYDVMNEVVDGGVDDYSFFEMDTVSISGVKTFVLAFGMAETAGYELFGAFDHHDEVEQRILEAGETYGMRQMGSKAYKTNKIGSGWIHQPVPAIYESREMADYREWLGMDGPEGNMSIGGSFISDDITDYYLSPYECGQGHLVDLDREFIGRDALAEMADRQNRERVTFEYDREDVLDVYGSLFREGDTYKYIDLPDTARQWSLTHYDRIEVDGNVVGVSKYPGYLGYERRMLSLGVIDPEYADPGTEVTLVWGEEDSPKQKVERHVEKEIRATVAPSPYVRSDRR